MAATQTGKSRLKLAGTVILIVFAIGFLINLFVYRDLDMDELEMFIESETGIQVEEASVRNRREYGSPRVVRLILVVESESSDKAIVELVGQKQNGVVSGYKIESVSPY